MFPVGGFLSCLSIKMKVGRLNWNFGLAGVASNAEKRRRNHEGNHTRHIWASCSCVSFGTLWMFGWKQVETILLCGLCLVFAVPWEWWSERAECSGTVRRMNLLSYRASVACCWSFCAFFVPFSQALGRPKRYFYFSLGNFTLAYFIATTQNSHVINRF